MKTSVKMIPLLLSCIVMQGAVDAAPASPTCSKWDLSGKPWVANDGGYQIIFRIDQRRPRFGGTAQYTQGVEGYTRDVQSFSRAPGANIRGSDTARISGVVKGDKIEISTEYGVIYVGAINVNGLARGQYHFKGAATVRATWGSSRPLNCLIGTGTQPTSASGTATSAHPQTPPTTPSPGERNASERGGGAGASALRSRLATDR